jgi:hypothetical protein
VHIASAEWRLGKIEIRSEQCATDSAVHAQAKSVFIVVFGHQQQ